MQRVPIDRVRPPPHSAIAVWVAGLATLVCVAACSQSTTAGPSPSPIARSQTLTGVLSGAPYRVDIPDHWNGTLLLYNHGTIVPPPTRRQPLITPVTAFSATEAKWLLGRGYALAGSAFGNPLGWAVLDALRDDVALLNFVDQTVGHPRRVVLWGDSQGGLDVALLLEQHRDLFAGGLALCPLLGGGIDYFNHDLDMFYSLDVLLAPGRIIHSGAPTRAGIDSSSADLIIGTAQPTAAGRARLALVAALQGFPGWFDVSTPRPAAGDWDGMEAEQLEWIRFALGTSFRQDVEHRAGGNPSSNLGVDYAAMVHASPLLPEVQALYAAAGLDLAADLHRLNSAPRIGADPQAVAYMQSNGVAGGGLRLPLATLHTTADGRVIPGNVTAYAGAVGDHGDPSMLTQMYVDRPGHCALTDAEVLAALQVVLTRLDSGKWPSRSPATVDANARAFGTAYATGPFVHVRQEPAFVSFEPPPLPR